MSHVFNSFLEDRAAYVDSLHTVDPSWLTMEFRPPRERDFVEHLERFGASRPTDEATFRRHRPGVLSRIAQYEGFGDDVAYYHGWLTEANLMTVRVPPDTSPGIRWSRLGYRTKKEALPLALQECSEVIGELEDGVGYRTPPCVPAGRGKLVDSFTDAETKQGRLILMPDLVRHLMGSITAKPYSKFVKRCDKRNGGSMIGMGPFSMWYDRLAGWIRGEREPKFLACFDFSGFDQTVPAFLLREVMAKIRRRFEPCRGSAAYWESEVRNLVDTHIAMPDGEVYLKSRGVASGDPWTSQAGSLANWMMWETLFSAMGMDARVWTFGDDVLVAVYDSTPEDTFVDVSKRFMWDVFGMEVKASASFTATALVINGYPVENKSASFLSNYFVQTHLYVAPTPSFESLIKGLLYPERNPESYDPLFNEHDNYDLERQRVSAYYLLYYHNGPARKVLESYWNYLPDLSLEVNPYFDSGKIHQFLTFMDIPSSLFDEEWARRLPTDTEVKDLHLTGTLIKYSSSYRPVGSRTYSAEARGVAHAIGGVIRTVARVKSVMHLRDLDHKRQDQLLAVWDAAQDHRDTVNRLQQPSGIPVQLLRRPEYS